MRLRTGKGEGRDARFIWRSNLVMGCRGGKEETLLWSYSETGVLQFVRWEGQGTLEVSNACVP